MDEWKEGLRLGGERLKGMIAGASDLRLLDYCSRLIKVLGNPVMPCKHASKQAIPTISLRPTISLEMSHSSNTQYPPPSFTINNVLYTPYVQNCSGIDIDVW